MDELQRRRLRARDRQYPRGALRHVYVLRLCLRFLGVPPAGEAEIERTLLNWIALRDECAPSLK